MSIEEIRALAMAHGYELRRRGRKQEHKAIYNADGEQLKTCYFPHLAITPSCYARTWKMLNDALSLWGCPEATGGDVWEKRLLLACEHIVRYLKREIAEPAMVTAINRLVNPLDPSEYVRNRNEVKEVASKL